MLLAEWQISANTNARVIDINRQNETIVREVKVVYVDLSMSAVEVI